LRDTAERTKAEAEQVKAVGPVDAALISELFTIVRHAEAAAAAAEEAGNQMTVGLTGVDELGVSGLNANAAERQAAGQQTRHFVL
jgi:hypothetical protein